MGVFQKGSEEGILLLEVLSFHQLLALLKGSARQGGSSPGHSFVCLWAQRGVGSHQKFDGWGSSAVPKILAALGGLFLLSGRFAPSGKVGGLERLKR